MQILIKRMSLRNFKGTRLRDIQFDDITNITGDNETGKTTIFDAFTWLLFGKNSSDAKEFNIKTLGADNKPIHRLEHEVSATLEVDGREFTYKRIFKEKWVKKRGEQTAEFTGHETEFYIDDVPLSQNDYKARVDIILKEDIAKLITNPLYFNQMKWQDRRAVLEAMAGSITNDEVAGDNDEFRKLIANLGDTPLIDFKKKIGAQKKKIKDTLESIPTRIDEAQRSMPTEEDTEAIEREIQVLNKSITKIDQSMEDKTLAYEKEYEAIKEKQDEKYKLENHLREIKNSVKQRRADAVAAVDTKLRTLTTDIKADQSEIEANNRAVANNNARIKKLEDENAALRSKWSAENNRELVIDEKQYECPTCQRALEEGKIEEIREKLTVNFNTNKAENLKRINDQGTNNKVEIDRIKSANQTFEGDSAAIKQRIDAANAKLQELYKEKQTIEEQPDFEPAEVKLLNQQIAAIVIPESPKIDSAALKAEKATITQSIDALKSRLSSKDQIARINQRIQELKDEEETLSQELADLERTEFTIEAFGKAKIETIESRINGKFKLVRFKMFEQQINGGETEACECLINGVPYSDANTASRINAGIDVINALTEHYRTNAPVWIDNRESIIRILPCKSQIINLMAVKDKPLTVTTESVRTAMSSN